ncbi:hypothetical protein Agub_g14068 [Astrephomene gubernaculifera]|uniref:SEC-C motif-containing protein n=1 Tax=Astrephomene gubernaculifera TaxID=47775 RepID=A0AAD3E2Y1_9CHLO|nr:hypothetical protein Agub_g14068 [Astrephomene gubernaculifera]
MSLLASRKPLAWSSVSAHRGFLRIGHPSRLSCVVATAGRRVGQENRKAQSKAEPRKCPCGSGEQYQECCASIVSGAWARTAPELARARFTAMVSGKVQMLADTTHPEALEAIGTKQSLLKKMDQHMRKRGVGELLPSLVDCVHGQHPDDPNNWIVVMAISLGEPGMEDVYVLYELYRKDNGRWWYMNSPREIPILEQFAEFLERYHDVGQGEMGPVEGLYDYSFLPSQPRNLTSEAARLRTPWLVDEWPADQQQRGWVYLDTAKDPETGRTAAQEAAEFHKSLSESLLTSEFDYETYYFRFGRFL